MKPEMTFISVDLPAPLGPITAVMSPAAASRDTSRSAEQAAEALAEMLDRQHVQALALAPRTKRAGKPSRPSTRPDGMYFMMTTIVMPKVSVL